MYTTEAVGWGGDHPSDDSREKNGDELHDEDATLQIRRFQKRQVKVNYHCEYLYLLHVSFTKAGKSKEC